MEVKEYIEQKLRETKRAGIEDLIKYLEESDFFTAPASTRYHGAFPGGLAEHSLNVYDTMMAVDEMLYNKYGVPKAPQDSIIIVALLHDLTKVNQYATEQKWRKDANGKWEAYDAYVNKPDFTMGHSAKSIYLAQNYITLSPQEAQAIFWHMGAYDKSEYNNFNAMGEAFTNNQLAYKLHTADMMATYILENETIHWKN